MWYFIRFTSDSSSKEELAALLGPPYIISKEYSRRMKLHYHIIHESSLTKEELKNLIYNEYPDEPKGVCTLKVDVIGPTEKDLQTSSSYTVKDGDYIYSSFFTSTIEEIVANSYKKPQPYPTALKELIEKTTDTDYDKVDWRKLKVDIAILRSEYRLEIWKSRIEALVLSIQIGMNYNVAEELFSCP